jgi:hypothetical protein
MRVGALVALRYVCVSVQYVESAAGLRSSDVRFYHSSERPEAEKIAAALSKAGAGTMRLNYLQQFEGSTTARPNHFEVWFAGRSQS